MRFKCVSHVRVLAKLNVTAHRKSTFQAATFEFGSDFARAHTRYTGEA